MLSLLGNIVGPPTAANPRTSVAGQEAQAHASGSAGAFGGALASGSAHTTAASTAPTNEQRQPGPAATGRFPSRGAAKSDVPDFSGVRFSSPSQHHPQSRHGQVNARVDRETLDIGGAARSEPRIAAASSSAPLASAPSRSAGSAVDGFEGGGQAASRAADNPPRSAQPAQRPLNAPNSAPVASSQADLRNDRYHPYGSRSPSLRADNTVSGEESTSARVGPARAKSRQMPALLAGLLGDGYERELSVRARTARAMLARSKAVAHRSLARLEALQAEVARAQAESVEAQA
ncbi:hypothetical protein JCM10450v2_007901 [Rhodotorula kratochvilovae]